MDAARTAIQIIGPAKVAELLGVSVQAACFWRDGKRELPAEHCAMLEQATRGAITRRDLRPDDWHRIWPELVNDEHPAPVAAGEG
jgi:DNA-binding transcriptional regulator YdaS (Cro superfamily)